MEEENSHEEPEQSPEATEEGSPVPDPERKDTDARDVPQAD